MGSLFKELGVEIPERYKRLIGVLLMAMAGICFVLADVLTQLTMQRARQVDLHLSRLQIMVARATVELVCCLVLMLARHTHPTQERGFYDFGLFTLLASFKDFSIYFKIAALSYIPVGDYTVLEFTYVVFTALFGVIFLAQKCSLVDSIFGALSFVGVIFVANPKWLLPSMSIEIADTSKSVFSVKHTSSLTINSVTSHFDNGFYYKGVIFSLLTALATSSYFVLNSYLGRSVPVVLNVFYPSVYVALIAPFIMLTMGEKFLLTELDLLNWTLLLLVGVLYFGATMLISESFQLENVGPVTLIRGLDIIYAFILQVVLIKAKVTWNVLVGAAIILLSTSLIVLNRWLDIHDWIKQRLCTSKRYEHLNSDDQSGDE